MDEFSFYSINFFTSLSRVDAENSAGSHLYAETKTEVKKIKTYNIATLCL